MKYLLIFITITLLSCSSDSENQMECTHNIIEVDGISFSKISVFRYNNELEELWYTYNLDSKNRISSFKNFKNGVEEIYKYNQCGLISEVFYKGFNGLEKQKAFTYNADGFLLKYFGGYSLDFQYSGDKVIIEERRGDLDNNGEFRLLGSRNEYVFQNDNLINSIDLQNNLNYAEFYYDANSNYLDNSRYQFNINYYNLFNPLYLVMHNTYGRKNIFLLNYDFHGRFEDVFFDGISPNLIHTFDMDSDYREIEVKTTSANFATEIIIYHRWNNELNKELRLVME